MRDQPGRGLSASQPLSPHRLLLAYILPVFLPAEARGEGPQTQKYKCAQTQVYCLPRRVAFMYTCQHRGSGTLAHTEMQVCKCTPRTRICAHARAHSEHTCMHICMHMYAHRTSTYKTGICAYAQGHEAEGAGVAHSWTEQ